MNTRRDILQACDKAMLGEISRGKAQPEVRDAFRRQLAEGAARRLQGGRVETQEDFIDLTPSEKKTGQTLLF